jgi:hypothetical protein
MSIELDRDRIEMMVATALRDRLGIWTATRHSVMDGLTSMITATIWEVAAIASAESAEKGILAGLRMIKKWED